jgi:hypothetical protein
MFWYQIICMSNKSNGIMLVHLHNWCAKIPLMQHPPKLVCPTKHGLNAMPPKLVAMSYLMEEHLPKGKWMIVLECVIHVTTIIIAPKNIIIMGQKNEHMYMFKNGLNMVIQLSSYYANVIQIFAPNNLMFWGNAPKYSCTFVFGNNSRYWSKTSPHCAWNPFGLWCWDPHTSIYEFIFLPKKT